MEFRWYIPPGKVLENTRIEERGHALHVSKDNWNKVTGHLDRNRLIQEAIDSEEAHKKHMRETSKAMTSTWTNSVENIRKRKEEERATRFEAKADINYIRFMELKKEQEEERGIYVAQVKKKMERKKEYPVALTSALILSEVMFERGKQKELDKKLKNHDEEVNREYFERMKENVKELEERGQLDEQKKKAKEKQYGEELKASVLQRRLEQEREIEEVKRNELENYEMNERELEEVRKCQHEKFMEKRTKQANDYREFFKVQKYYKDRSKKDEEEAKAINKIIQESNDRIRGLTKLKEEEFKQQKRDQAERIAKLVGVERANNEAAENAILLKVAAEKEEQFQAKIKAELEKKARQKKERREDFENDCKERENNAKKEKEIERWECLNRIKTLDEVEAAKKLERLDGKSNRTDLVKAWNMQLEEKAKIEAEKEEERRQFEEEKANIYVMDDEQFFQYAEEVREFAKEQGWITYPIDKVRETYKVKVQHQPPAERPCVHYKCPRRLMKDNLLNKTPGKMAHNPVSDPNYSSCRCKCHKDLILK